METTNVDFSEFRDKLCHYLLESEGNVAVTRDGDVVGLFIPARRKGTVVEHAQVEHAASSEAHSKLQAQMKALGITEEDIIADFESLRKKRGPSS